jgi:hypothetical protein
MAGGCAKIALFDAGATLVDVNSAKPNFSKNYREPSLIIRIGLDQDEGQWCEKIFIDGCPRLRERRLIGDVIVEHNKVFQEHGRVMFGRFEILCPRWWNMMHNFLNASHVEWGAKLMIVLRMGRSYQGFSTRAFKFVESCETPSLAPEYYRDLIPDMYVWFEIGELTPMQPSELAKYTEDIVYAVKRKRSISKTLASAGY